MANTSSSGDPRDKGKEYIEHLKSKLPDYLAALNYLLEFSGEKIKMCCPFHNDTNPSFEIYGDELNRWHCHPCGCGGDIFDFSIKAARSTDFKSAKADVEAVLDGKVDWGKEPEATHEPKEAQRVHVLKDGEGQKIMDAIIALNMAESLNQPVMKLIEEDLGFDVALLRHRMGGGLCTLGLYEGRLAYCYSTGLKVRRFRSEEGGRFFWVFGKAVAPWRIGLIKETTRKVVIVEGESDCVVAVLAGAEDDGVTLVVASPGTSFPSKWASYFRGKDVTICFDLDRAGQEASERVAQLLKPKAASVSVVRKDVKEGDPKDLRELFLAEGATAVLEHIGTATPWVSSGIQAEQLEETSENLPMIQLPGDNRPLGDFCSELGAVLAGGNFYCRSGMAFASIATLEEQGRELKRIEPHMLRSMADANVRTIRYRKTSDGPEQVRRSMDLDTAQAVLSSPMFLSALPPLDYIRPAQMPIIRKDGSMELLPVGYDRESRTLTHEETRYDHGMNAETAKHIFNGVLSEFQFADERSKAATVAALLTGFSGHLLPQDAFVPCFLFDANAQGSGKTTLAQIVALPYGVVAVQPAPKHEAEWRKRLLPMIMAGRGITIMDNVDHHIDSAALSMYLTSYSYSDRILGASQEYTGKPSTIILMTGNKMTYSRDLARRVIVIDLFSAELRAEERQYKKRMNLKLLKKYRKLLMAAMWALVKEWDRAGRPKCSTTNSSFPDWCEVVGGIVEHNGFGDPAIRGQRDDAGDIDTLDLERLAKIMGADVLYLFKDIVAMCGKHGLFERFIEDTDELGQLSKSAKSGFGKTLKSFDKRMVKGIGCFRMKGKGHSRCFAVESLP